NRMIEMQQQPFPSIQKSQPEKIVVDKSSPRTQHDVENAEAHPPLRCDHFCAQRRVAIHVIEVVGQSGIGMVKESANPDRCSDPATYCERLVDYSLFHATKTAPKKA